MLRALVEGRDDSAKHAGEASTTPQIYGIKGILSVRPDLDKDDTAADFVDQPNNNIDRRRYIVQAVHDLFDIHPGSQELDWMPDETRSCRIVLIGKYLDEANMRAGFLGRFHLRRRQDSHEISYKKLYMSDSNTLSSAR